MSRFLETKTIQQYRFYNDGNANNYPANDNITKAILSDGRLFKYDPDRGPIVQLGIQTLPGTRFYLNGAAEPVIVGTTGIFEVSLLNQNFGISDLQFNHQSLEIIEQAETGYLIIDIIYDSEVQA